MSSIVILDMGGQYAHLLARRVRQLGVYSSIKPAETPASELREADGIILSGGPSSVYDKSSPECDRELFSLGKPVLGLCYGHQLIAQRLGGKVKPGRVREYGTATIEILEPAHIFRGMERRQQVWMSHGDEVAALPEGFKRLARTENCDIAAMGDETKRIYGLQFHPEVTHTPNGLQMLDNFINACGCRRDFSISTYFTKIADDARAKAGSKKVFLLVSGGVDSVVCFALLEKILGPERVHGLLIDNGLLRKNEAEKVKEAVERLGFRNFHVVDASETFLEALKGVTDPEEKRRIIGETFIRAQQDAMNRIGLNPDEWILAQGTIYPDTIETKGTQHADLIKTHHNRVPIVMKMIEEGKILEPLSGLYKDEVRELGLKLGLPDEIVFRHPFPGPGLAVRCLCSNQETKVSANNSEALARLSPSYVNGHAVLPIRSVGVQGDARSYKHPAVLWGEWPGWDELEKLSTAITNTVPEINRVLWLVAPKSIDSLRMKKGFLTKERLGFLREADDIVQEFTKKKKLYSKVWQFPVVLVPLGVGNESVILRPVESKEAMTARFARIDYGDVEELAEKIRGIGADLVLYDITNKPPATIEWE